MQWPDWSGFWQSPQWLWLALVFLVPLVIHLLQRSAPREITFAAARWLQERQPQSWKRLQLRDRWLLALRLLLLATLVALVAGPLREPGGDRGSVLLVDPRIEAGELDSFLQQTEGFDRTLWLQPQPQPVTSTEPHTGDLWHSLSSLAAQPEFRDAHILLRSGVNAGGYRALRYSPHWQWHTLQEAGDYPVPTPVMAVIGDQPHWLEPMLQQLADSGEARPEIRTMADAAALDPREADWLLYNRPGALPESARRFARGGGLLITDERVTPTADPGFAALTGDPGPARQAAALGRGSWLRYRGDWDDSAFYRRPELPEQLWHQWTRQDWPLHAAARPRWSVGQLPGAPVPDEQVATPARAPLEQPLLLALLVLLLVERAVTLSRRRADG
ncbi:BatA domain-containing protein [Microbulbifer yueqingensis]|uniref:N-terminal double-transmembrane domain-containing protein n=1 Tax=Microbulbifer yueqingensis TaxID=658219 RepID=A0A1G9C161_9GAMM|nr:BatA domain-containing protein [Microbulbifer yueqingensis]SDK45469.1 N-terminal double-transmembrane domain-containing protein [Microbulbifer yueqingensis]